MQPRPCSHTSVLPNSHAIGQHLACHIRTHRGARLAVGGHGVAARVQHHVRVVCVPGVRAGLLEAAQREPQAGLAREAAVARHQRPVQRLRCRQGLGCRKPCVRLRLMRPGGGQRIGATEDRMAGLTSSRLRPMNAQHSGRNSMLHPFCAASCVYAAAPGNSGSWTVRVFQVRR